MRAAVAGFAIGVAWLQQQASLPDQPVLWLLAALALLTGLSLRWPERAQEFTLYKIPTRLLFGALLGVVWATLFALHYLHQGLPPEWEGKDVTLTGTVASLPNRFEQGVRFHFVVERAQNGDEIISGMPPKVSLSWYEGFRDRMQPAPEVRAGERWQLTARLKRPHGDANPHGFDYESWLLEQDLRATGYVRPDDKALLKNRRLDPFVISPGSLVERARGWLRERIVAALPDKKYAGVLVALVVGDQRAISQSDWAVFNRSGISHLVSISGLHITLIAGLFAALASALWRRSFFTGARLPLILPAQKVAALAGAAMALLYVLLAGFGVPAQRTLYMLSVVAAALWFGRIAHVSHLLSAALGVTLLLDPWAVLWPGFWLSFGAVAAILYASVGRTMPNRGGEATLKQRALDTLKTATRTQTAVTLGLVPLTMLLFGQISVIGPIANAVAIPLVSFVVMPLALLGSVLPQPLSGWVLNLSHFFMEALASALGWMTSWPQAVWSAPLPSAGIFLFALIGTAWMLAPRGWPSRWLGAAGWLPLVLNAPTHPAEGEMWVTAFDVGQGSAVLVETERHRLLFDAGPFYSPESDGGNRVILPYLKARGIHALEAMVVSHNDSDHSGGALSVMQSVPVGWLASSLAPDTPIVRAASGHYRCETGQGWSWDGVRFEMLHPTTGSYASAKWKPNARSCMLKVTAGGRSILLPGDIEVLQEDELTGSIPEKLLATVLLAPHHGSGTSSSQVFLQAVRPEIALFQVGYLNRYGHPRRDVYDRYGGMGIERIRTDESGAVTMKFGETLTVSRYRQDQARYWHGR